MEPSDDVLVQRAVQGGDAQAFDRLVRRHQGAVRSLLRRLCRDAALADDLAQETFVKAHSSLERFAGAGSFRSWLGGIAYREFLMAARKRRREGRRIAAVAQHEQDFPIAGPEAPDAAIDLDRALAQLPDRHRAALVLNVACGLTHPEIARAMGAPLGTVKTWIASAKTAVRAQLEAGREPPR